MEWEIDDMTLGQVFKALENRPVKLLLIVVDEHDEKRVDVYRNIDEAPAKALVRWLGKQDWSKWEST